VGSGIIEGLETTRLKKRIWLDQKLDSSMDSELQFCGCHFARQGQWYCLHENVVTAEDTGDDGYAESKQLVCILCVYACRSDHT